MCNDNTAFYKFKRGNDRRISKREGVASRMVSKYLQKRHADRKMSQPSPPKIKVKQRRSKVASVDDKESKQISLDTSLKDDISQIDYQEYSFIDTPAPGK